MPSVIDTMLAPRDENTAALAATPPADDEVFAEFASRGCTRTFGSQHGLLVHRQRAHGYRGPHSRKRVRKTPKPTPNPEPVVFDRNAALAFVSPGRPAASELGDLIDWLDEGERLFKACTNGTA